MTQRPLRKDPISISYTGWKRYNTCPQQHLLVMTGHRPKLQDERNFLNGQVLHKVLERWFGNEHGPEWIAGQTEPVWDEYVEKKYIIFKSDADRAELRQKCIDWGSRLAVMIAGLGMDKGQCHTELSVERFLDVDGYRVRLHGYIDVLAPLAAGGHIVLDLKASTDRKVMDPYQMVFYSLLLQDPPGSVRESAFLLPALDDIVPFTVTDEHRDWLLADITRVVRAIIADQFPPQPGSKNTNCFWCEVKHACPVMSGSRPTTRGRVQL